MPRFKIYGAHSKTGEDVQIRVTADTVQDAEAIASGRGIFVSRIVEIEEVPPQVPTGAPAGVQHRAVQTIEKTGKGWKLLQLLGMLGIFIGAGMIAVPFVGEGNPAKSATALAGCLVTAFSIIGYMFARLGGWWYHG